MATPMIELCDTVGFGMIVPFPSGVHYSNQTAGTFCLHPTMEGVYVPLANDCDRTDGKLLSPENDLLAYFEGPIHCGTGAVRGLSDKDADFIDGVLANCRLSSFLLVDRMWLADSHEAWVWGIISGEEALSVFSGFGPYPRPAIMTWCNSD